MTETDGEKMKGLEAQEWEHGKKQNTKETIWPPFPASLGQTLTDYLTCLSKARHVTVSKYRF